MTALDRTVLALAALAASTACGRSMPDGARMPGPAGSGGAGGSGGPGGQGGLPGSDLGACPQTATGCTDTGPVCSSDRRKVQTCDQQGACPQRRDQQSCHAEAICADSRGRAACLQLSAGDDHVCALVEGKIHCWGAARAAFPRPALPQGWINLGEGLAAVQVSAGRGHSCALVNDGTVRCWGSNLKGELGTGRDGGQENTPVLAMVAPQGLAMLSAGVNATCGITNAGALACWGWSTFNQFALDAVPPGVQYEAVLTPVISAFFARDMRDFALTREPTSEPSCGVSGDSVLCNGRFMSRRSFGAAEGITRPTRVKVGGGHVCALDEGRRLHCWGANAYGRVGIAGPDVERPTPVLNDVTSFALGWSHTCAVTGSGQVLCWGDHAQGALGIGDTVPDGTDQPHWKPTLVPGLEPAVQVTAGARFTCALGTTGRIWCWGSNEAGQLGLPAAVRSRNRPVEIPPP